MMARIVLVGLLLLCTIFVSGCRLFSILDQPLPSEEYLAALLDAGEGNAHGEFLRAKRLLEQGEAEKAERVFKKAISLEPARPEFRLGLAAALEAQGKLRASEQACHDALALNPRSAQAQIRLGRLAWMKEDLAEARKWADRSAEHDDSAELWRLRGEIAYISLNHCEALRCWQESLRRSPSQAVLREMTTDLYGYLQQGSESNSSK